MDNIFQEDQLDNNRADFNEVNTGNEASAAMFNASAQRDKWLGGSNNPVQKNEQKGSQAVEPQKTLTGKELPVSWPDIVSPEEELEGYSVLYDPGEERNKPPTHPPVERLSFTLKNGQKELRYMAVQHIFGSENRDHLQFRALKENFDRMKPQIVLYEGPQGNPETISEDDAYEKGEKAYMQYLVLEHNKHLKPGEAPIIMASCDFQEKDEPQAYRDKGFTNEEIAAQAVMKWMYYDVQGVVNTPGLTDAERLQKIQELQALYEANPISKINPDFFLSVPRSDGKPWTADLMKFEISRLTDHPLDVDFNYLQLPRFREMFNASREFRDQHIVKRIANASKDYDRVMVVMGSGHAIREKQALEQFFDAKATDTQSPSNSAESPKDHHFMPDISLIPEQGLPDEPSPDIPVGVTRFQTPDGKNTFDLISVDHTGNVQDVVHRTIREAITTRNPQIVITEGHPTYRGTDTTNPIIDRRQEIIAWTKAEVEKVQQNNGVQDPNTYIPEAGYAAYIAQEHGIPSIGGEPAGQELFDLMKARGYTREDVIADRFLREIEKIPPEKRETMGEEDFSKLLDTTNELVDPLNTVNLPSLTLDGFKQWYSLHPLSENRRFIDVVHKDFEPHQDGSYSQVMTCHSGVVRDQHLVRLIADLQNQGYDNILAAYGLHHLPSLRPALEDKGMFGNPGEFTQLVKEEKS